MPIMAVQRWMTHTVKTDFTMYKKKIKTDNSKQFWSNGQIWYSVLCVTDTISDREGALRATAHTNL